MNNLINIINLIYMDYLLLYYDFDVRIGITMKLYNVFSF